MTSILIVDDELPARERMVRLVRELDEGSWLVAAAVENGQQAVDFCNEENVDVILMDIRMPVMDGLQAAKQITETATEKNPAPAVIFTTAYGEHALEAFEAHGIGYLLKPIRKQNLLGSLQKARQLNRAQLETVAEQSGESKEIQYISGSFRGANVREPVQNIIYFQAEQKYVMAYAKDKQLLMDDTLKSLEERFADSFLRIHRNALVAKDKIIGLTKKNGQHRLILQDMQEQLEISRRHFADIKSLITN